MVFVSINVIGLLALQQLASLGVVVADLVASYTRAAPVASHEASANAPPPSVISPHVATKAGFALHRVWGCRAGRKDCNDGMVSSSTKVWGTKRKSLMLV